VPVKYRNAATTTTSRTSAPSSELRCPVARTFAFRSFCLSVLVWTPGVVWTAGLFWMAGLLWRPGAVLALTTGADVGSLK
jgi:hypothetical protein